MPVRKNREDEFTKKLEAWEEEDAESILSRFSGSERELSVMAAALIRNRELLRDAEIEQLEAEAANLLLKLEENKRKQVWEIVSCFRDVLAMHRHQREENERRRS